MKKQLPQIQQSDLLGPSDLRISFRFNPETQEFEIRKAILEVLEGELAEMNFVPHRRDTLVLRKHNLPQNLVNKILDLIDDSLTHYLDQRFNQPTEGV